MTTRQLRNIAAYYPNGNLTFHLLQDLANGDVPNFKLRLRKLESLTDEELWEIHKLAGGKIVEGIVRDPLGITLIEDGEDIVLSNTDTWLVFQRNELGPMPALNVAAIVAYLQSIGVWVPGTIEEEFVSLID